LAVEFQLERSDWQGKVSAAELVARQQQDAARVRANAANMQHSKQLAAAVKLSRENSNEINKFSKDLSSCKLDDGLVRLLNNATSTTDAGAGAD
jgi:formylmethanofuran dehydrogenase subunit E